jgi:hypothetical protein
VPDFGAEVRPADAGLESDTPRLFAEVAVMPVARSLFDVASDGRLLLLERTINQSAPLAAILHTGLKRSKHWFFSMIRTAG